MFTAATSHLRHNSDVLVLATRLQADWHASAAGRLRLTNGDDVVLLPMWTWTRTDRAGRKTGLLPLRIEWDMPAAFVWDGTPTSVTGIARGFGDEHPISMTIDHDGGDVTQAGITLDPRARFAPIHVGSASTWKAQMQRAGQEARWAALTCWGEILTSRMIQHAASARTRFIEAVENGTGWTRAVTTFAHLNAHDDVVTELDLERIHEIADAAWLGERGIDMWNKALEPTTFNVVEPQHWAATMLNRLARDLITAQTREPRNSSGIRKTIASASSFEQGVQTLLEQGMTQDRINYAVQPYIVPLLRPSSLSREPGHGDTRSPLDLDTSWVRHSVRRVA